MKILGVKIDNLNIDEVLDKVEGFLSDSKPTTERGKQHYIVTSNPEFLVKAQEDEEFKKILNNADLSIPDGVGLVFASLLSNERIKERVAGVDLMEAICKRAAKKNWPVFLFGAEPGVSKKAAENLKVRYENLKIKIHRTRLDEYILPPSERKNVALKARPIPKSILFVALGAPKQEKWIAENLKKMPDVKLAIGVGGSFDFISGKVQRAPEFMRTLGFEWLWRLIIQPWRIKRIFNAVVVFPWLVLKSRF